MLCGSKIKKIVKRFELEIKQQLAQDPNKLLFYISENDGNYFLPFDNQEINVLIKNFLKKFQLNNCIDRDILISLYNHQNDKNNYKLNIENKDLINKIFENLFENFSTEQTIKNPFSYIEKEKLKKLKEFKYYPLKVQLFWILNSIKQMEQQYFFDKNKDPLLFMDSENLKIEERYIFYHNLFLILDLKNSDIENLINFMINNLINNLLVKSILPDQNKFFYFFYFFSFNKEDQIFFKCLKLFTGMEQFLNQYHNFVKIVKKYSKEDFNDDHNIYKKELNFENVPSLNREKLFNNQEIRFFSYFLNNAIKFDGENPSLRNKYIHEGMVLATKDNINENYYRIGLILFIKILYQILQDIEDRQIFFSKDLIIKSYFEIRTDQKYLLFV